MYSSIFEICRKCYDNTVDSFFGLFHNPGQKVPNLSPKHAILLESAVNLAAKIKNKELRSEDLVQACIERIKEVNPVINAVTDERFDGALNDAREIDEQISSETIPEKPFLGVPFTVKESFAAKGMLNTLGLKARQNIRATEDSESVRLMKESGAILVAVTNVPEACRWIETRNMVFGQTRNPYHTGRTSGGSSGGEAALNAAIATPISLCGDTGGSTRMPAFYCGLYALCPTAGHTNNKGSMLNQSNMPTMGSVCFLSRHCSDLIPLTTVVTANKATNLKLDRVVDVKKLKYNYVESAGDKRVSFISQDLKEAMNRVVNLLKNEAELPPTQYSHPAFKHMFKLWRHRMSCEAVDFPRIITNNQRVAKFFPEMGKKLFGRSQFTIATILGLADYKNNMRAKKRNSPWAETNLKTLRADLIELLGKDGVLLFPSCPTVAPYHFVSLFRPFNFAYWAIFNALEFPSAQVPLGLNNLGLPLGIQVVAAPCNDALCVAVAGYVGPALGGIVPPCNVPNEGSYNVNKITSPVVVKPTTNMASSKVPPANSPAEVQLYEKNGK